MSKKNDKSSVKATVSNVGVSYKLMSIEEARRTRKNGKKSTGDS